MIIGSKHEILRQQLSKIIREKDGLLSKQEQKAMLLHVYESRGLRESAQLMGCSIPAVKEYIRRGVFKLRNYFIIH